MTISGDPERLGSIRLDRRIGEGGMGVVYQGWNEKLERKVAVKLLLNSLAEDKAFRERFMLEARAMAKIQHEHVVQIFSVDEIKVAENCYRPFLEMEYLEGIPLNRWLADRRAEEPHRPHLEIRESIDFIVPVLSGLAAAHEKELVHRDVTPRNLFRSINDQGEIVPKVLDFGIVKTLSVPVTIVGSFLGTFAYAASETLGGGNVDHRADQFSLAAVLYECLCGQRARPGKTETEVREMIYSGMVTPLRSFLQDLPTELESAIAKALSLNANDRFPTMYHFGLQLLPFASASLADRWRKVFEWGASKTVIILGSEGEPRATPASDGQAQTMPDVFIEASKLPSSKGEPKESPNKDSLPVTVPSPPQKSKNPEAGGANAANEKTPSGPPIRAILAGAILVALALFASFRLNLFGGKPDGGRADSGVVAVDAQAEDRHEVRDESDKNENPPTPPVPEVPKEEPLASRKEIQALIDDQIDEISRGCGGTENKVPVTIAVAVDMKGGVRVVINVLWNEVSVAARSAVENAVEMYKTRSKEVAACVRRRLAKVLPGKAAQPFRKTYKSSISP